ncbi:pre-mRNA-splicing factor CLF1 [Rhizoctonia solani]|uniref:Pre-mRNA-splicing factor CLF1 n=1 Tax=Rhizoctonia solani TaxID=456999 RepID=A0A8H8T2A4_9AGAM|nr:pre-mRNA-splicing factor CLF1 [Rhizoctonia solani]QRW25632.1 pre-mRNA-splicing factor CLF1 [Rhizoctonia solani]
MSDRQSENRAPRVKNRAPAAVQITAEQLLREAQERQESAFKAPRQRVEDFEELHEYRGRKRKEFEERIRRTRGSVKEWQAYASWEASQGDDRSRSVYERALDVDARDVRLWLSYTEMNYSKTYQAHDRCLSDGWLGNQMAWQAYINSKNGTTSWIWAKFEEERGKPDKAREVFQTALEFLEMVWKRLRRRKPYLRHLQKMETRLKEYDRARVIYKFALSRLPRSISGPLYAAYTKFEKQHGEKSGAESAVLGRRRIQYEDELQQDPFNYVWFDYTRLEEEAYRTPRMKAKGPKKQWAEFEKCTNGLSHRTFPAHVNLPNDPPASPHKSFTFAKLWIQAARFEIRQLDLPAARKLLGAAIGMCPKEGLFKGYIQLELELREFDRVRTLYEKYLSHDPSNTPHGSNLPSSRPRLGTLPAKTGHVKVWVAFALFEAASMSDPDEEEGEGAELDKGDPDRARAVFQEGYDSLRAKGLKEERVVLLEAWKAFEQEHGTEEQLKKVEDWDMLFADDEREANPTSFKLLQMAHAWKNAQAAQSDSESEDEDADGEDEE